MIHILLLILKIIGIVLAAVLIFVLLLLFFPVIYTGKADFDKNGADAKITAQWMFHLIHFRMDVQRNDIKYALRVLGIPILRSGKKEKKSAAKEEIPKEKGKREYRKQEKQKEEILDKDDFLEKKITDNTVSDEFNSDNASTKKFKAKDVSKEEKSRLNLSDIKKHLYALVKRIKRFLKDAVHNIKSAYAKIQEIKSFITANTTKEAYNYAKKIIIKLTKHIFPNKVKADMTIGFDEPHLTGEMLGVAGIIFGTLRINPKKIVINPEFENKVFEGWIKCRGHMMLGVVGIYILKIYFKQEIRNIIKKFN